VLAVSVVRDSVRIPAAGVELETDVVVPPSAAGVVGFVHRSGSSRHSHCNRYVAAELQAAGVATVLADPLMPAEEAEDARTAELRFDINIDLLAAATAAMVDWLGDCQRTAGLDVGRFGASTGRGCVGGSGATAGWGGGDRVSWRSTRPGRRVPGLDAPADAPHRECARPRSCCSSTRKR
jgi:hypothetical protein